MTDKVTHLPGAGVGNSDNYTTTQLLLEIAAEADEAGKHADQIRALLTAFAHGQLAVADEIRAQTAAIYKTNERPLGR